MSGGASSWAFREDDSRRITDILRTFLSESSARTAMIVDRTGQLVSTVGEPPERARAEEVAPMGDEPALGEDPARDRPGRHPSGEEPAP